MRAERREIPLATPLHASHAHDAQHEARHPAAHIFLPVDSSNFLWTNILL